MSLGYLLSSFVDNPVKIDLQRYIKSWATFSDVHIQQHYDIFVATFRTMKREKEKKYYHVFWSKMEEF